MSFSCCYSYRCCVQMFWFCESYTHYTLPSVLFILLSTETFVSTATYNLASITVPYAIYGCQTRNIPTTVPTVDSVVSAGARTFVTVKIVECALTNNSSPVITVRLASI